MKLTSFEPVEHGGTFYGTLNHLITLSSFLKNLSPQKIFKRELKLNAQKIIHSHRDL